ncbi:hypothetical protein J3R30DRAFT_117999 [Lentinula aciculospora]|uniref:Uncharacterized protein n=1 Tax=Lentinula aciculospora TaxID=153920 RepID=A0A9W9DY16_9AGAR|nr:hypothetical protein J3R30DRAFT_117999 [Lentinula aciculospora]
MSPPIEQLTAQDYDLQFGVNVLGHFLLIQKLLPLLKTTSNSLLETRIVWVASSGQYYFRDPPVKYDNLTDTPSRKKLRTQELYVQSKFITVMLGFYLGKVLAEEQSSNVICIHLDPGNIQSDLYRHLPSLLVTIIVRNSELK